MVRGNFDDDMQGTCYAGMAHGRHVNGLMTTIRRKKIVAAKNLERWLCIMLNSCRN